MSTYKRLIASHNNSIEPKGTIGKQKCGIIFWQKTAFLKHCNLLGFNSIIQLINKKYIPTRIDWIDDHTTVLIFDNDNNKSIYLTLKNENNSKHLYIYGESHTAYVDASFHIFALDIVEYISKQIGTKFYVDDATEYVTSRSREELEKYIFAYQQYYYELCKTDKF